MANLPKLSELLGETRGDGFEEWAAESWFASSAVTDDGCKATLRIMRILTVAMIEAARLEDAAGSDCIDTVARVGRGAGTAFMAMVMAPAVDSADIDELAEIAKTLFAEGVDYMVNLSKKQR